VAAVGVGPDSVPRAEALVRAWMRWSWIRLTATPELELDEFALADGGPTCLVNVLP
jgi:hypothetical protein